MEIFGYEFSIKSLMQDTKGSDKESESFVEPSSPDAAVTGGTLSHDFNLEETFKASSDLIAKYRQMAEASDVSDAIDDIMNEAIVFEPDRATVEINLESLEQPDKVKEKVRDAAKKVLRLLDFNQVGDQIFREWYIDGQRYYHVIADEKESNGIKETREIDSRYIRKIRNVKKEKNENGVMIIKSVEEFYIFQSPESDVAVKISLDSIAACTSGKFDAHKTMVHSFLHKAIKPWNNLAMLEDSLVIYRVARAPERRAFYIDTGSLPKTKAEAYVRGLMTKMKSKFSYDSTTGAVKDSKSVMSMMEDIWLPRKEGSTSTEIQPLGGGQNLGEIDDVTYFRQKLYKSLNVPYSRFDSESTFSIGRSNEISREEVKFNKFITRLRKKFALLFLRLLRTELLLTKVITEDDWEDFRENIGFDFANDSQFVEMKQAEVMERRMEVLGSMDDYVGKYFSEAYIRREILKQSEKDIEKIDKENKD